MTVGEAVDAYRMLQNLSPQALSRDLTNEVVDAAQTLEAVAVSYSKKMQKHRKRLGGEGEEITEEVRSELQEIRDELRDEPADVDPPSIDPYKAPSIAVTRELLSVDALAPLIN